MERDILKYLYKFYKRGDYFDYHSLAPVFNKIKKGDDYKYFLERIRTILGYFRDSMFLEMDNDNYGKLASIENTILQDYINCPIKAKIIYPFGVDYIERIIVSEQQIRTNNFVIANICFTILLTGIIAYLQIKADNRDEIREKREVKQELRSKLNPQEKFQLDSIMAIQNTKNLQIIARVLDSLMKHK